MKNTLNSVDALNWLQKSSRDSPMIKSLFDIKENQKFKP